MSEAMPVDVTYFAVNVTVAENPLTLPATSVAVARIVCDPGATFIGQLHAPARSAITLQSGVAFS
ncbi:hypothetical protein D3C83_88550 [compost metagenome]